jgi:hypothetical protein
MGVSWDGHVASRLHQPKNASLEKALRSPAPMALRQRVRYGLL